jgi:hypothetical protein
MKRAPHGLMTVRFHVSEPSAGLLRRGRSGPVLPWLAPASSCAWISRIVAGVPGGLVIS